MDALLQVFLGWFLMAVLCTAFSFSWWALRRKGQRLLPAFRQPAVPWSGLEVCLAIFCFYFFSALVVELLLANEGFFFRKLYGSDFVSALKQNQPIAKARGTLWTQLLVLPLQTLAIPILFHLLSRTRPYQLGFTFHRWPADTCLACLTWLALTPFVFSINVISQVLYLLWGGKQIKHPLTQLMEAGPAPWEWVVIVFIAVVGAPVLEEIMFRGVLQKWLAGKSWGGEAALAGALVMAALRGWKNAGIWPMVFVIAVIPAYLIAGRVAARWIPQPSTARAIYGTSLLFAALHSSVWPTPISLFVLGLGLGWLAYRTRSLVSPIALHVLFNATAIVTFFADITLPSP